MTLYVDAWLDCQKPYVKVVNKYSRQVLADFSGNELSDAVEKGEICISDFYEKDSLSQLELIKSLLLLRCCQDICQEIHSINQQISRRAWSLADGRDQQNVFRLPLRYEDVLGEC